MSSRWSKWKREWHEFAAQPPGRRFRQRHDQRRAANRQRGWWRRVLNIGVAIVLLAIGAFLAVAPGPAFVFFAVGGLLIANEWHAGAFVLDKFDVWLAPVLNWAQGRWHRLSRRARRVAMVCMISGSVCAAVAGFLLMRK